MGGNQPESILGSVISAFNTALHNNDGIEPIEPKKIKTNFDPDTINRYVAKYKIEDVNLSNLQKLHEKELVNVPFFQKLRRCFNPQIIKPHLMEALGISKSYTGFHEFMRGERDDLPNIGLCNIAKTVGYDLMIIPVPEDLMGLEMARLKGYQDSFIAAVEQNISTKNIPTSKAKSKKTKQKDINQNFLGNLGKSEDEIMSSLNTVTINDEDKIGADEVFNDGQGEVILQPKNFAYPTSAGDSQIGIVNDSMFDMVSSKSDFMGGYDDSLGDFAPIFDENEFNFGISEEDNDGDCNLEEAPLNVNIQPPVNNGFIKLNG